MENNDFIVGHDDPILVTGANGFIGRRVVENLLNREFQNLICFGRPSSSDLKFGSDSVRHRAAARITKVTGNLLSRQDCEIACKDAAVIFHLAAGTGEKSFPDAVMNSVVTTRNLLDAVVRNGKVRRFVLVSSFSVYSNRRKPHWRRLDESCPIEEDAKMRGEAYCFAKIEQEQIVKEYGEKYRIPYVIVRPGSVYGAGRPAIVGRVGIDTFGIFLHMGGSNTIPFTHVDNCAEAIVLGGLVKGVDAETFNVVDDDLPSSRQFLRLYKKHVRRFRSVYVPHFANYILCCLWEKYSRWSHGQLPLAFNRLRWHAYWKKTRYTNEKLKSKLGWKQIVTTPEGLRRYFQSCRQAEPNA